MLDRQEWPKLDSAERLVMDMNKCRGCGVMVDGDVCDSSCAETADNRRIQSKLDDGSMVICEGCEEPCNASEVKDYNQGHTNTPWMLCEGCAETEADRANERSQGDAWGAGFAENH